MRWLGLCVLGWAACERELPVGQASLEPEDTGADVDLDGDGWGGDEDCDDEEPLDHPDATEDCSDGRDNDCDGDEDEADADCDE